MSQVVQQFVNNTCLASPVTSELWKSLQLDHYLQTYPGAQNITLITSFNFGMRNACLIISNTQGMCKLPISYVESDGDVWLPCAPVPKLDWLILYSIQQWNFYMNSLYEAIESAINIVREAAASAIVDFTPKEVGHWMGLVIAAGTLASLVLITAGVISFMGPVAFTLIESVATEAAAGETIAVAAPATAGTLVKRHQQETLSTDLFSAYAKLDSDITMLHSKLKIVLFKNVDAVLNSPIYSQHGVSHLLKDGVYLDPNPSRSTIEMGARDVAQLTVMSELFKSLHPCDSNGPNDALARNEVLSYCSDDGLMMNIVQAQDDLLVEEIRNGHLLQSKYGYTTRYLATTAWSCQQKSANKTIAPGENQMNSQCVFTIPVCDLRLPAIKKQVDDHDSIVVACRESGNLPI